MRAAEHEAGLSIIFGFKDMNNDPTRIYKGTEIFGFIPLQRSEHPRHSLSSSRRHATVHCLKQMKSLKEPARLL